MGSENKLFEPLELGALKLKHRVVLAPLTRMRADEDGLFPREMAVEYYRQRASEGGLLISEATLISSEGLLDHGVPGLWTEDQVQGWKKVVDAVHEKGGLITCQLWHTGRIAHASFREHPAMDPNRQPTVSASDVQAPGPTRSTFSREKLTYSVPRPLALEEIPRLLDDYRNAARNAKRAGFDGVEIHSAHGYLLDQFLNDGVNKRTDKYGGSIENRCRLMLEVVEAVGEVFPFDRIGVRLSPHADGTLKYYGTEDSDPDALYAAAVSALDRFNLAYLLLSEPRWFGGAYDKNHATDPGFDMDLVNPAKFRKLYRGKIIGAGGFTPITGTKTLERNLYDAIGFGRWFISNPDLPQRIRLGQPLHPYVRKLFYAQTPEGYIDYPEFKDEKDPSILVPHESIGKTLAAKL